MRPFAGAGKLGGVRRFPRTGARARPRPEPRGLELWARPSRHPGPHPAPRFSGPGRFEACGSLQRPPQGPGPGLQARQNKAHTAILRR